MTRASPDLLAKLNRQLDLLDKLRALIGRRVGREDPLTQTELDLISQITLLPKFNPRFFSRIKLYRIIERYRLYWRMVRAELINPSSPTSGLDNQAKDA